MIDFDTGFGYGLAPAELAEDAQVLTWAQKWADNTNKPVHFTRWDGEIVKTVEADL